MEEFGKNFSRGWGRGFDSGRFFVAPRFNQLRVGVLAPRFNQLQGGV